MRATIKDIAKKLNISPSTVSRALADRWDVNPETRNAVLEVAKELNYVPNPISLSLKLQQSMTIGLVVPEYTNSFFSNIMTGIKSVIESRGYSLLIMQSGESPAMELKNLKILESKLVDGFIVSVTHQTANLDYYNELLNSNTPLVFVNRICPSLTASAVLIDDRKWASVVVEHLIENGCRRIVCLRGPKNLSVSRERYAGYLMALRKHHIHFDGNLVIDTGIFIEDGIEAAHRILEGDIKPDAIFCFSDPVAIGVVKTLKENGVSIPGDILVSGFSESRKALIIEPNLTSVEQPTFEIGKTAAELLLEQIKNKKTTPRRVVLEARLNVRESTTRKHTK